MRLARTSLRFLSTFRSFYFRISLYIAASSEYGIRRRDGRSLLLTLIVCHLETRDCTIHRISPLTIEMYIFIVKGLIVYNRSSCMYLMTIYNCQYCRQVLQNKIAHSRYLRNFHRIEFSTSFSMYGATYKCFTPFHSE